MLSADQVQAELDKWIKQYVSGADTRSDEIKARRPLQNAQVNVWESADKPGVFNVALFVTPHYQAEEFNITLSLVAEMPERQA
jgi:predicted component of type VI protein secretion system